MTCENENTDGTGFALPASLPGLNVEEGLNRLGGETALYLEIVAEYADGYRNFSTVFKHHLAENDLPKARREAHSLKGAAGNMAAVDLQEAAKALEFACAEKDLVQIGRLLPRVETALTQVLASAEKLGALAATAEDRSALPGSAPGISHEPGQLEAMFSELAGGLQRSDPVLSDRVIRRILSGKTPTIIDEDMKRLSRQVSRYDFSTAVKTLQSLIRKLQPNGGVHAPE